MTSAQLLPLLVEGGLVAGIASVFGMLHRSAVRAYKDAAATWRETAQLERTRADELSRQLFTVLGAVKDTAGAA